MKNSIDTIGNRTRDLPARSIVPQPTTPPLTPLEVSTRTFLFIPHIVPWICLNPHRALNENIGHFRFSAVLIGC